VAVQENVRAGPAMNFSQADCRVIFDAMCDAILIHEVTTGEILEAGAPGAGGETAVLDLDAVRESLKNALRRHLAVRGEGGNGG